MLYRFKCWFYTRNNYGDAMRVRVTLVNGSVMNGMLTGEVVDSLGDNALAWILNDDNKFIPFVQPSGREVQLLKNAIAWIAKEEE